MDWKAWAAKDSNQMLRGVLRERMGYEVSVRGLEMAIRRLLLGKKIKKEKEKGRKGRKEGGDGYREGADSGERETCFGFNRGE